jgi:copper chaperone CopZ
VSFYASEIRALVGSGNWTNQEVTVTLIIADMTTDEDAKKLSNTLRSLPGVTKVLPLPVHRLLTLTYNPTKISLEAIGYQITMLGYRYIHKI